MSSINLKINEKRNVIQSYYNGKWNDLSNRNIDPKLYPAYIKGFPTELGVGINDNRLKTPDGYLDTSKLTEPNYYNAFPIHPYNGIVVENIIGYEVKLAVHTNTLRLIPNVPKEIFNTGVLYNHGESVIAKRAYNGNGHMVSIFGELPGFTSRDIETSTYLTAITLPVRAGENIFTDTWYGSTITLINVQFLPE